MSNEFLTTDELTAKYFVADMDSKAAWYKLLMRWRDKSSLKEGADYVIERRAGRPPVYRYREAAIKALLLHSDSMFAQSIRIEYKARILRISQSGQNGGTEQTQAATAV